MTTQINNQNDSVGKSNNIFQVLPAKTFKNLQIHTVILKGFTVDTGKYGKYVKLEFEIEGSGDNRVLEEIVTATLRRSDNPRYTSHLYSFVSSLLCRDLPDLELIDLNQLIGKKCKIVADYRKLGKNPDVVSVLKESEASSYERSISNKGNKQLSFDDIKTNDSA